MEIELKYALENSSKADRIWNDNALALLGKGTDDERRTEMFESTYYDTEDHVLLKNDIAYRVRKEDSRAVASLKWNGKSEGPLHIREELNASLGEWDDDIRPDPDIFSQSEIGAELLSLIGDSDLIPLMKVNFRRRMFRADTGDSLLEFSLDEGEILTENGSMPISELEIELFSGEKEALEDLEGNFRKNTI